MATRLDGLVVCGEINNTRLNCVFGFLGLKDDDQPIMLELTGNCDPDLAGTRFRFEAARHEHYGPYAIPGESSVPPLDPRTIARQQIGPTGTMTAARRVRFADCPPEELVQRLKLGEPPTIEWKPCLYLEWYSQNGRVVLELVDPIIEFLHKDQKTEPEDEPETDSAWEDDNEATGGFSVTSFNLTEDGDVHIRRHVLPADEEERDSDLIRRELQEQLDQEAFNVDRAISGEDSSEMDETRLMDELIEKSDGAPMVAVIRDLENLPDPAGLSDSQVEQALKAALAQMAMFGTALDVCEHFSMRDAYVLLRDRLRVHERIHPEIQGTQWVWHFSTSDYCKQCGAEFENADDDEQTPPDKTTESV